MESVQKKTRSFYCYPPRGHGIHKVTIEFPIHPDGHIGEMTITSPHPPRHDLCEDALIEAVKKAAPFPPPPWKDPRIVQFGLDYGDDGRRF